MFSRISLYICVEQFDIDKFSDPHKYGWDSEALRKDYRQQLEERQKLLQIYQLNKQSVTLNMIRSAVAPGWGHISAKSYTKGQVFIGIQIVLLGTTYYFYDQAMDKYDKYKAATQIDDINQFYNDAQTPYRISQSFLGLSALVWIYSIYDSVLETNRYNNQLWNDVHKEYRKQYLSFSPTGITLHF